MHDSLTHLDQPLQPTPSWREHLSAFSLIFCGLFLTHLALLRLPYFWDEAGYYIPAARDFLLGAELIPHSTLSNAHPPMLSIYLAAWWKLSGYTPAVTRIAMLIVTSFTLLGIWRIACTVANRTIAAATVLCTAAYPVFFAQSSLAHLDMLATAFTVWGLAFYIERKQVACIVVLALGGLAKETGALTPILLGMWEIVCPLRLQWLGRNWKRTVSFALCGIPLALWFVYLRIRTGYVMGDPYYYSYNMGNTMTPLRVLLAFAVRVWHAVGFMNLFVLTLLAVAAMLEKPQESDGVPRRRIALPIQLLFYAVIVTYTAALAVLGGAVLARYMLPVYPFVILVCVSTLYRRLRWWPVGVGAVVAAFIAGLIFNPPYRFAPEDNLTYRDYVVLHRGAAAYLAQHAHDAHVLTAWPASDEISRPFLGYVKQPIPAVHVENFSPDQMMLAQAAAGQYDWVYLFSTKYEPPRLLFHSPFWEKMQTRYFDYHVDVAPELAAKMLGGKVVYQAHSRGEWVAVIHTEHVENALSLPPKTQGGP